MNLISMDKTKTPYQALLLGGVCALVSLALLGGHELTHEAISENAQADRINTLNQVLPAERYNNNPLNETLSYESDGVIGEAAIMLARHDGDISATTVQLTVPGWGGPLNLMVSTTPEGEILGVRVISHTETPGLGDKIETDKSDWITSFDGHSLKNTSAVEWAVKKDGGNFDQFTGATITPRSVVKGVHRALEIQARWQTDQASNDAGETP